MIQRAILAAIRRYQSKGGAKQHFNLECNFKPSCSEYTHQAISKHGTYTGIKLGLMRIRRCNDPDCVNKIHDPVPEKVINMSMEQLKLEEDELRKEIAALPTELKKLYFRTEEQRIKDPDTYAVLNYFFLAGLHHFYLGKSLFGALNLLAMLLGIIFFEFGGWVLFILVIVIELPQLFRSQSIVQKYNNGVMRNTLSELTSEQP